MFPSSEIGAAFERGIIAASRSCDQRERPGGVPGGKLPSSDVREQSQLSREDLSCLSNGF
jgi:hypothetical protein